METTAIQSHSETTMSAHTPDHSLSRETILKKLDLLEDQYVHHISLPPDKRDEKWESWERARMLSLNAELEGRAAA
mgnify:CR=1 FL=1